MDEAARRSGMYRPTMLSNWQREIKVSYFQSLKNQPLGVRLFFFNEYFAWKI